ncbi:MAG TPA: hypothetical protein VJR29_08930 [bacterium]|nr:hypothetical protein [bacterium]
MNLQNVISGQSNSTKQARDLFFREFDGAMKLANRREDGPQFQQHVSRMEEFGQAAGIAANEIAYRRSTLLYSLSQGR